MKTSVGKRNLRFILAASFLGEITMKSYIPILVLLLTACQSTPAEEGPPEKKPIVAEVAQFQAEELYDAITFAGTIRAKQETHLYAPLSGTVEQHFVEPGASVRTGQEILSLRPDSQGQEYQVHVVKAPVPGTLISIDRDPTEHVNANEEIGMIADLSQLIVDIHATQSDLPFLHIGEELRVLVGGEETTGEILRIAQRADPESRAFPVRVALQSHPSIRLGTFARILAKKNPRQGFRVPLSYLHRNQTTVILLDEKDNARWVEVKVGQLFGDRIEILEGIDEGSRVMGNASRQPEEGEHVQLAEPE